LNYVLSFPIVEYGASMAERPARSAPESTRWLTETEQNAWIGIALLLVELPSALDAQLQRDSGINLFEYFVLSRLSMTEPDRSCRMSELRSLVGGSLSRLSNVVKRLEQRGLLRREPDPADGRYTMAILTDAGMDMVVAAAPGHVDAVRELVIDSLTPEQMKALGTIGEQRMRAQTKAAELAGGGSTASA
jgi:DNA-binding MarR family transcriptional regulator